ncbi:hsp70 nucleotide exchange factor Fes1p [Monosporozyma servazzii]
MEKLLQWSIANTSGDKEAKERAGQLDPKLLEQLFNGGMADDPTLMKQAMQVIVADDVDVETKLVALDNFEMLIEKLDNANNIENMKLWDPLLATLKDESGEIRAAILSIIGTSVQNNKPSQDNFLKYKGALRKIIDLAENKSEPVDVRVKALYALSNLIRNHGEMAKEFAENKGLDLIPEFLNDDEAKSKLKMRAIAVLSAFLGTTEINDVMILLLRKDGVIKSVIDCLQHETDLNLLDRILNFLSLLLTAGIKFTQDELDSLRSGFEKIQPLKDRLNEDDFLTVNTFCKLQFIKRHRSK